LAAGAAPAISRAATPSLDNHRGSDPGFMRLLQTFDIE
jgi:hypothetical protein